MLLESYQVENCLSFANVVWIAPTVITFSGINIGLATTTIAVNGVALPLFALTSTCLSTYEDGCDILTEEAKLVVLECELIKDSIVRIFTSILGLCFACENYCCE
jgi:hypothetical protein